MQLICPGRAHLRRTSASCTPWARWATQGPTAALVHTGHSATGTVSCSPSTRTWLRTPEGNTTQAGHPFSFARRRCTLHPRRRYLSSFAVSPPTAAHHMTRLLLRKQLRDTTDGTCWDLHDRHTFLCALAVCVGSDVPGRVAQFNLGMHMLGTDHHSRLRWFVSCRCNRPT